MHTSSLALRTPPVATPTIPPELAQRLRQDAHYPFRLSVPPSWRNERLCLPDGRFCSLSRREQAERSAWG